MWLNSGLETNSSTNINHSLTNSYTIVAVGIEIVKAARFRLRSLFAEIILLKISLRIITHEDCRISDNYLQSRTYIIKIDGSYNVLSDLSPI